MEISCTWIVYAILILIVVFGKDEQKTLAWWGLGIWTLIHICLWIWALSLFNQYSRDFREPTRIEYMEPTEVSTKTTYEKTYISYWDSGRDVKAIQDFASETSTDGFASDTSVSITCGQLSWQTTIAGAAEEIVKATIFGIDAETFHSLCVSGRIETK